MNTRIQMHPVCCQSKIGSTPSAGATPPSLIRRCRRIAEWIVPAALLALVPKCPLCLVAYVAIATGVGLSISAATYLHFALIFLFAASLLFLATRLLCRGKNILD